jgi:hypothetical protein
MDRERLARASMKITGGIVAGLMSLVLLTACRSFGGFSDVHRCETLASDLASQDFGAIQNDMDDMAKHAHDAALRNDGADNAFSSAVDECTALGANMN